MKKQEQSRTEQFTRLKKAAPSDLEAILLAAKVWRDFPLASAATLPDGMRERCRILLYAFCRWKNLADMDQYIGADGKLRHAFLSRIDDFECPIIWRTEIEEKVAGCISICGLAKISL